MGDPSPGSNTQQLAILQLRSISPFTHLLENYFIIYSLFTQIYSANASSVYAITIEHYNLGSFIYSFISRR